MIKALHTTDSLNRDGSEMLVLDVFRNASRFGIDLTVAALGGGSLEKDFGAEGGRFVRLEREYPLDLNVVWKLRGLIKDRGIEIVHGHKPVEMLHLYLATRGLKGVMLVQSHRGVVANWKNRTAAKLLSPRVDANVVCGRGVFHFLRAEFGLDTASDYFLIRNAVDPERLNRSGASLKEELELSKDAILIGMVANFVPAPTKDQFTVCRALPKVFESNPEARFVFAGRIAEGAEDYLDQCISFCDDEGIGDRVYFLGGREDVADVLNSLDLFVYSSLREGLPMAVAEAMIAGVPVVVSDIDPLLEVTNDGKCAEIFQRRNAVDLAEKICALLDNEKLLKKRSADAREFAQTNFLIDSHLQSLSLLYSELLEGAADTFGTERAEARVKTAPD